ncbi:MAG: autotransporter domain-containing protein [Oceanicaulis sp.]
MRRSLLAAASIAAIATSTSWAQEETIDTEVTDPVDTATIDDGQPANIVISGSGRVRLTGGTGPAVRVNSDNTLEIASGAQIEIRDTDADGNEVNVDGAVGVQVDPGVTTDLDLNGLVSLGDSYSPEDDETDDLADRDEDGDLDPDGEPDGPFAQDQNKTGLLIGAVDGNFDAVPGQAAVTGDVNQGTSGRIEVAGQNSYGVRVAAPLDGDLLLNGTITMRGEDSAAVSIENNITGDVQIRQIGATTPRGVGARIGGDVGGGLRLTGTVEVSGYRVRSRVFEEVFQILDPDNNDGGDDINSRAAVIIAGSIEDGVFVASTANVTHLSGGGAAIEIGGDSQIEIGETVLPDDFDQARTDDDSDPTALGYSVVNEGNVNASGIFDGRDSTAFLIGGFDESNNLRVVVLNAGGMLNTGAIEAVAFDGTATALHLGGGVQAGTGGSLELRNTGRISATTRLGYDEDGFGDDDPATLANESRLGSGRAFGLVLDENSEISRLLNDQGQILAFVIGGAESGTAIKVSTESLQTLENTGLISASLSNLEAPYTADQISLVAIDASTRTTGLHVLQERALDDQGEPVDNDVAIRGDVLFGSGDDRLELLAGELIGDVSFGEGADQLIINGASLRGAVSDDDVTVDLVIDVTDGTLALTNTETLEVTEANFNAGGVLELEVSSAAQAQFLTSSGAINFNSGSDLSVSLANLIPETETEVEILSAGGGLNLADADTLDATEAPFLYQASLARSDTDPDTLVLTLRRKTADELGLDASRAAAYDEAFSAFQAVNSLSSAMAAIRTQEAFFAGYNQLLPEYATSALQFALAANDAGAGALSVRLRNARMAPDELAGVWAQEFAYFADRAGGAFGPGYRGQGVGLAIGLDRPVGPFYAVGVSLLGAASEVESVEGFDEPMVALSGQLGTYAGLDLGGVDISGALSLGYDYFESERNILIGDFASINTAEWNGWHVSASAQAGRDFVWNNWVLRPEASLTYLSLFESGYTESVEDNANAPLALIVDDRQSAALLGAATFTLSRRFGTDISWWAPSLSVGYRGDFLNDENETTAQFGETGSPFTLRSTSIASSGALIGFGLSAGSNYSTFTFAYDADVRDDFVRHVARLVIRLTF